jgi:DNA invertase Pin-like site-specific DNA recombinase
MFVGYVRISTSDDRQSTDLQRDALLSAGVDERNIHEDKASGARDDRPELKLCLEFLRPGDILIVWKLDRLGRSLPHLIEILVGVSLCARRDPCKVLVFSEVQVLTRQLGRSSR